MSRIAKLALVTATAAASVAALATPALAWTGGSISATLSEDLVIDSSIGGGTCTTSTLGGSITSGGDLTISSAAISGCSGTYPITVTVQNLNWGGSLTGGVATITGFRVSAVVTVPLFGNITCIYGGTLVGSYTGSSSPVVAAFDDTVDKVDDGSHWFCPGTADVSGEYTITGTGL